MRFKNFDELLSLVRGRPNRIVSPGADTPEVLESVRIANEHGLVSGGVLIGDTGRMRAIASEAGLGLDRFELVHCLDKPEMCRRAVDCLKRGRGDFLVKGLVDTAIFLKAVLDKGAGLVPDGATLTHFVLFETAHYHKLFAVTDSAILISPTLEQKQKIIENAVRLLRDLGADRPKVAVICPVEKVNHGHLGPVRARWP